MTAPLVQLCGLRKAYRSGDSPVGVLEGLDLAIVPGEFVAIVGPSGCGKTTLLNIIAGLDREFEGQATVAGVELRGASESVLGRFRNEHIGFVFQHFNLIEQLSVDENISLPALFTRASIDLTARRAELLARVELSGRGRELASRLSGGQKQRVAIARALFCRPKLLLCDEPTGNLDTNSGAGVITLFRELQRTDGVTLVVVTHEARVSEAADRILRLDGGQIVGE